MQAGHSFYWAGEISCVRLSAGMFIGPRKSRGVPCVNFHLAFAHPSVGLRLWFMSVLGIAIDHLLIVVQRRLHAAQMQSLPRLLFAMLDALPLAGNHIADPALCLVNRVLVTCRTPALW